MKQVHVGSLVLIVLLCGSLFGQTQQTVAANTNVVVPPLVNFNGVLADVNGKALTGVVGVTFSLYKDEQGGSPLWIETQNVQPDKNGQYSVQLGAASSQGLPSDLFSSGEARWLGVQAQGQAEQPRVMLLSVPYALKAGDAQTVGGLPASAFALAVPGNASGGTSGSPDASVAAAIGGSGTADFIPIWTAAAALGNSVLFQSGSGSSALVGINTTTPASTLDVNGGVTSRGNLQLPSLGTANASQGYNSQPLLLQGSAYNSSTSKAIGPLFQWQTEPSGNNTSNPTGTLNLLYGTGSGSPAETGLNIASNGLITFATGQAFPGTGNGTITGVNAGAGLSGGGTSGNVTLTNTGILGLSAGTGISISSGQSPSVSVNTSQVPLLSSANTFTGNQTVNGNLSATGVVTGSSYQIGGNLFAFGSYVEGNAFLGYAGYNAGTTGFSIGNTAIGDAAFANGESEHNTAVGSSALQNSNGCCNSAVGWGALYNVSGSYNIGVGQDAGDTVDGSFITSANNTFLGTGTVLTTGSLTNATAIGANAQVGESNAIVLGSINGVNGQTVSVNVGIGTYQPATPLDVAAQNIHTYVGAPCPSVGVYAGIAFGNSALNCTNYSLQGDGTNTYLNAPSGGNILFRTANDSGPSAMEIDSGAYVGIGTNSITNIFTIGQGLGHAISDGWSTYSSRRWKTNIVPLTGALSKVERLRGVSYDLKDSGKHEIGVIAEEVGEVVPEVVTYEDNGKDARGVDYSRLTALLIQAVKEQQQEIADLRGQLRQRAAKDALLESRLAQLERKRDKAARLASAHPASESRHKSSASPDLLKVKDRRGRQIAMASM